MIFKKKPIKNSSVLQALGDIKVPGSEQDIIAAGFVKRVQVHNEEVSVFIELSAKVAGAKSQIKQEAEKAIQKAGTCKKLSVAVGAKSAPAGAQGHSHKPQNTPQKIKLPGVKHVIAVASGKGGVGKSTVTINLATSLAKAGHKVGILDADIYGPSIPLMLGVQEVPNVQDGQEAIDPLEAQGIKVMSMAFFTDPNQPVVWRGPMVHSALTQFMVQVNWGTLDYLLIDMPPGTGDAQLTISQNAPLSGAIIVTTPQRVSTLDARKGLLMFQKVQVPILGVIENMSGHVCSQCQHVTSIFKSGGGESLAIDLEVPFLGKIPLDARVAQCSDDGVSAIATYPESKVSLSFLEAAKRMKGQLQQTPSFEPQSLQWQ